MFKQFLARVWNTNPLWLIGAAVLIQFLSQPSPASWWTVGLVALLAYLQNTTYALQSRSANRNSNAYHLLASVAASGTFFASLMLLSQGKMPLALFTTYVFFTILGTLNGTDISIGIEKMFRIRSGDPVKGSPQLLKLWPTVAVLLAILAVQIYFAQGHVIQLDDKSGGTLVVTAGLLIGLVALTALAEGTFTLLRLARSTDSYWFHAVTVLVQIASSFLKLAIMLKYKMDWTMVVPITTGGVIGNLILANFAQDVAKRIQAGFDIHVLKGGPVHWPVPQIALFSLGLVAHVYVFGLTNWWANAVLLTFAFGQAASFTLKSRAGQRKHKQFIAWSSVGSNGVWYLTLHALLLKDIGADQLAPYVVGSCIGSLVGQLVAMRVEQRLGEAGLMDDPAPKSTASLVTA